MPTTVSKDGKEFIDIDDSPESVAAAQKKGYRVYPGKGEATLRGLAQGGTMGWADELSGGVGALLEALKGNDLKEGYEKHRDYARKQDDAASESHPDWYNTSQLLSAIASGAVTPAVGSLKGLTTLGAVGGLGVSKGDALKGEVGPLARDAGLGALTGAAGYGAGKVVEKAVKRIPTPTAQPYPGQEVLKDLGPEVETVVYRILGKESKPHFVTDMDFPDLKDLPHGPILSSNGENSTALAIYNGQRGVLVKGPVTAFFADKK